MVASAILQMGCRLRHAVCVCLHCRQGTTAVRHTISLLGSTGSIGQQTLAVVAALPPDQVQVVALAAGRQMGVLVQQLQAVRPQWVAVATPQAKAELLQRVAFPQERVLVGPGGLDTLAALPEVSTVVMGLPGQTGLRPSLAALQAGKQLLTANKETFVAAGHLVQPYLKQLIPLDSEHSAIFQCLQGEPGIQGLQRIWLTASGGPFRQKTRQQLAQVTVADALNHPVWRMGSKVSIDSATLMNKALEVIEAHWLFGVPLANIQVLLHPQSIVHSLVEWQDGSQKAQLGSPDMRVPILYGLAYPQRYEAPAACTQPLDLTTCGALTFEPLDETRFPAVALVRQAFAQFGAAGTTVVNAADEWLVQAFLAGRLPFLGIEEGLQCILEAYAANPVVTDPFPGLDGLQAITQWCEHWLTERQGRL